MKYSGICCACFSPIYGEPYQFRPGGRKFHAQCISNTGNYYVRLERKIISKKEVEKDDQLDLSEL